MTGMDAVFRTYAKTMYGVTYLYQKTEPVADDMRELSALVEAKRVRAVVGKTTPACGSWRRSGRRAWGFLRAREM